MQGLINIIDTAISVGFNYFYGMGDEEGYLRRMLHTTPSLEAIYAQLRDDIQTISEADKDYFKTPNQLKNFKNLKKYILEAKKYIAKLIQKKKKGSKSEKYQIEKELRSLDKDFRNGMIDKEDYDYATRILLRPVSDNLDEVKTKFDEIDGKVKQELKKIGYEEESQEDFDEEGDRGYVYDELGNRSYRTPASAYESKNFDIEKLVDDKNRRYTMGEFNDLYEDIAAQQTALKNRTTNDPLAKKNNQTALKLRNDRIKNLIAKKKIPTNMNRAQLDKLTDEQLAGLENA